MTTRVLPRFAGDGHIPHFPQVGICLERKDGMLIISTSDHNSWDLFHGDACKFVLFFSDSASYSDLNMTGCGPCCIPRAALALPMYACGARAFILLSCPNNFF